ncbi:PadR family transcriptional regulator [Streptomyces sp. SID8366]|uniref:PadR family transcriptional regulator n=1 Tax=unclassified Streptomyces TaxID=2593676 RepID=UPI000DBA2054|nr:MULTISPECIES: PadR family transcriptional regulator [Streptomyces]MYU08974.1 PadR family transcriptional regulator [Streptomyces sp. SID8366]MYU66842.1 PadR family transcriptional regulator [Streptomyces sp. SID69]RAJ52483.1 PadR family transcriptional regulator [Streptomyces sp. PsTaAH-130]TXJ85289.1 PadR family transcriptional regulator [Streptomyces lavendulae]
MSTRHILLGLLEAGPSHGYDLKRRHDERFPQARPLAYGQVYTTLQRLVRDGLAEIEGTDADGGPERTLYRSTVAGARELAHWAGEIAPPAPFVTNEIFAKVVVSILAGGDPAAYLRAQQAAHKARMRELTAVKTDPGADLASVLSADYALNHLDADLRWMTTTGARLTTLTSEVETT